MTEPLVSLRGVTKWFGPQQVLRGVDLEVPAGSVTALLARNGAGKSTLMRILIGLVARDGGEARVLGRDPEDLDPVRDRIAWVTDTTSASPGSRVADEIELVSGLRDRWNDAMARELLARFELPLDKRIGALSKGMQTRLRLILALAAEPDLLLLDEPALGLDLFARHDLLEAMIEVAQSPSRAIVCATHLLDDVERVADRVVFLREGSATVQGDVEGLRDRFRRVRVELGAGGREALESAAAGLLGVKRLASEPGCPPVECVLVMDDFSQGALDELLQRTGARTVEVRRMTLREIYFEALSGREEGVTA